MQEAGQEDIERAKLEWMRKLKGNCLVLEMWKDLRILECGTVGTAGAKGYWSYPCVSNSFIFFYAGGLFQG